MKLNVEKIRKYYSIFFDRANNAYLHGDYSKAMRFLRAAAFTRYNFYLGYKDEAIEALLKAMSEVLERKTFIAKYDRRCVIYDSFSLDNAGLVQQFLGALIANNYHVIYITEKASFLSKPSSIRSTLENCNAEIIVVPNDLTPLRKSQFVYNTIIESGTEKLLIHTGPDSVYANVAFYALPNEIKRYKLNLTDHTFWIGSGCIDYSFEFRPWGGLISKEERGVPEDHIFLAPFYPIMNHIGFMGFPKATSGKVIILSGGSYYKIYDKNDTFFKLSKAVLEACPNSIILFAGTGDQIQMTKKLAEYGLTDKFLLIGYRKDITEIFENADIYLNTFPIGGGLMTQYAAQKGIPVISYCTSTTSKVEEFVCQKNWIQLSYDSIEQVVEKVKRWVENKNERQDFGFKLQRCVITPEYFNQIVEDYLNDKYKNISSITNKEENIHEVNILDKIEYEAVNKEFSRTLVKTVGLNIVMFVPSLFFDAVVNSLSRKIKKYFK